MDLAQFLDLLRRDTVEAVAAARLAFAISDHQEQPALGRANLVGERLVVRARLSLRPWPLKLQRLWMT